MRHLINRHFVREVSNELVYTKHSYVNFIKSFFDYLKSRLVSRQYYSKYQFHDEFSNHLLSSISLLKITFMFDAFNFWKVTDFSFEEIILLFHVFRFFFFIIFFSCNHLISLLPFGFNSITFWFYYMSHINYEHFQLQIFSELWNVEKKNA